MMMVKAAALEALLKARAVDQGHRFVEDGKFNPPVTVRNSHDLVRLAEHTALDLSHEEEELLQRLSLFLEGGRYPIAKDWDKELRPASDPADGKVQALYHSSSDEKLFEGFLKRLGATVRWF